MIAKPGGQKTKMVFFYLRPLAQNFVQRPRSALVKQRAGRQHWVVCAAVVLLCQSAHVPIIAGGQLWPSLHTELIAWQASTHTHTPQRGPFASLQSDKKKNLCVLGSNPKLAGWCVLAATGRVKLLSQTYWLNLSTVFEVVKIVVFWNKQGNGTFISQLWNIYYPLSGDNR